jgi:lipoprotein-releasing system permease protein
MPYEFFLAFRHLRSRHKRRLAHVTALIAVVGIAVGVAALIVALSLANGFRDEMRDKILRGTAHLTVMRSDGQAMKNYEDVAARVAKVPGVVSAAGTTYDGAVITGKQASAYAVLRGIDTSQPAPREIEQPLVERASSVRTELSRTLVAGSTDELFAPPGETGEFAPAVLGVELAARTGLKVGDVAEVIGTTGGFSSQADRRRNIHVVGIVRSGLFEYDSTWIYLPLDTAAALSGNNHAASVVGVQVSNIYEVKQTAANIKQLLGESYTTVDWQEANRPLFTALAFERRIGVVIIALIILIAALNITTTLILIVMERRRDIAILNTMGATSRSIMSVFLIEGAIVGALGATAGVALGALAIVLANHYRLISLPADVYSISNVPLNLNWRDVALAALVALVLSIVATVYPARAAARIRPAEMLRDVN